MWHSPIPASLSERLGIAGCVFYPLPTPLVDPVKKYLLDTIRMDAVADEREISKLADERGAAAFRDGVPIRYRYLVDRRPPLTAELLREAGSNFAEKAVDEASVLLSHDFRYAQAYCGWLMNQSEYWSDLDKLVAGEHQDSVELPAPKAAILTSGKLPIATEDQAADIHRYKTFYGKWRLQTLETHDLPLCVSPQLTGTTVYAPNSPEGTINPMIPDIFPIDGKGLVSSALEAASRSAHAPHLDSWKELIGSSSRTKKRVDTFGRQFVLQHYWRVLTQRYPEALARKVMVLDAIFAEYFGVSVDMIRSDRRELDVLLERRLSNR